MNRLLTTALCLVALVGTAQADGLPQRPEPPPPPPQGQASCLMTALQMGYLTGRKEIAYANTEACILLRGSRGAVLPYGYYGPYVPPDYFAPPGWLLPVYR